MNTVIIQAANEQVEFTFVTEKTLTRKIMIDLIHEIAQQDVQIFAPKLQAQGVKNIEIDYVDGVKGVFVTKSGALKRAIADYELFDKMRDYEECNHQDITQEMIDFINQNKPSGTFIISTRREYLNWVEYLESGKMYCECKIYDTKKMSCFEYKNLQIEDLDLDIIRNEIVPHFCTDGNIDYFIKRCSFEKRNGKMLYYFDYTFKESDYELHLGDKVIPLGDVLLMLPEVQQAIERKMKAPFSEWLDVSKSQHFDYYPSDDGDGYRR